MGNYSAIKRAWRETKAFISGLAPMWVLLGIVLGAALSAGALQRLFHPTFSWRTFVSAWGSLIEIAGVFFIVKEVWSAHGEVGAPNPLRAFLNYLKQIVYIFKDRPRIVGQLSGTATITLKASGVLMTVTAATIERRLAVLEGQVRMLETGAAEFREEVEGRFIESFESIKKEAARIESLDRRLSEEIRKIATGPTVDKLSGALLILFGLVLNSLSGFIPA